MKSRVWVSLVAGLVLAGCPDDTVPEQDMGANNVNNIRVTPNNANNTRPDMPVTPPADMPRDMPTTQPDDGVDVMCTPGEDVGCADSTSRLLCNAQGTRFVEERCPGEQNCLQGQGCTSMVCLPGTLSCANPQASQTCNGDGSGYEAAVPCPQGAVCSRGTCKNSCELGKFRSSYIGCEYWSLDLDNYPDPMFMPDAQPHAVVVSNPNDQPATISFQSMDAAFSINVPDPVVPAGTARAFNMPRMDVSGTGITMKSIKVTSTIPVVAHQFNPLNDEGVFSNDASLLLPANTLGKEYYVLGSGSLKIDCPLIGACPAPFHAFISIVATEPGETAINLVSRARIKAGDGINSIGPNLPRGFRLQFGEVLNVEALPTSDPSDSDLSGTYINADKNIAVFAGVEAISLRDPSNAGAAGGCCADHLEQQMYPLKDWGTNYFAALSPGRGIKKDQWRILAGEDGVQLTTNPPQPGANNVTLNKGDIVSFFSDQNFEVNATGKILVGQYLLSAQQTSFKNANNRHIGDPALILAVPTANFRKDYYILTPQGYDEDYITIIRPVGLAITRNGAPINTTFSPIGAGAFETGAVRVQPGVQVLEADQPFGVAAYGYNEAVSYGYPGGLNLIGNEGN